MTTMSKDNDDDNVGADGAPNTISGGDGVDTVSSIPLLIINIHNVI